jgi:hypothetical protein
MEHNPFGLAHVAKGTVYIGPVVDQICPEIATKSQSSLIILQWFQDVKSAGSQHFRVRELLEDQPFKWHPDRESDMEQTWTLLQAWNDAAVDSDPSTAMIFN